MNKKLLTFGLLVTVISFCLAIAAVWFTGHNYPEQNRGKLVFAKTVDNGLEMDKAVITTPEGTVTLMLENNYWVIKEADYYYAGIDIVNDFFRTMNTAVYFRPLKYSPEALSSDKLENPDSKSPGAGTRIETFSGNQLLDSVIIGKQSGDKKYQFARASEKNEIWMIDADFLLPPEVYSWLMQPILNYSEDLIEQITITDTLTDSSPQTETAARSDSFQPFWNLKTSLITHPQVLLERLVFLIAEDVRSAQNFDEKLFKAHRRLTVTTFSGLITTLDLYYDNTAYWLKITLSTTSLPTSAVNAYIRDNAFLYDGWYFKIPAAPGKVFAHYKII